MAPATAQTAASSHYRRVTRRRVLQPGLPFRQVIAWVAAGFTFTATALTTIVHWGRLTSPYGGAASEILVRPVVAVLRIGIVFAVFCAIGFLGATLAVGKLPQKVGRREVEFDEGPSDEAGAAESLAVRIRRLEQAHQELAEWFDEHERSHFDG